MSPHEWNAADYAENSTAQLDWARELIRKLDLQGHEDVLDIGSGDGKVTAEIAALVPRGTVTGIDSSRSMVEFASNHHSANELSNLRFVHCDATSLPFNEEFDAVFSNAALHWVKDHRSVLDGISRASRPGGRAVLQMGGKGNAAEIIAVIEELAGEAAWAPFFRDFEFPYGFYSPQDYLGWLGDTALEARELELVPKDMVQPGSEGLAGWIRTTWFPFTSGIPDDLVDDFVTQLVDRYITRFPIDANGAVHVRMVRLEAHLVKTR